MKHKQTLRLAFVFLLLLLVPLLVTGQEFLEMPKVTHSDKGVPTFGLKLIKEIKPDFDKDLFFAIPWDLTVSKDKNFFYLQFHEQNFSGSIFKFNLSGKLVEVIKNIHAGIKAKRNGLFYGLSFKGRNPVIYRKEEIK